MKLLFTLQQLLNLLFLYVQSDITEEGEMHGA